MNKLDGIVALAALLGCLALFIRCTLFSGQQVRQMKWRTRLRMRPGAGFASHWEITFRFSRLAALSHGRRCRPDLRLAGRLTCPAKAYAVRLGRAQLGRTVYGRGEDQVSIIAPQRTNKTGILADRVYGHPGACVAATTRADLYTLTSGNGPSSAQSRSSTPKASATSPPPSASTSSRTVWTPRQRSAPRPRSPGPPKDPATCSSGSKRPSSPWPR